MAKQVINIGSAANDGSGDPLRDAYDKCNDNFTEVYDDILAIQGSMPTTTGMFRSAGSESCAGTVGEVIAFSLQFASVYTLIIMDYQGIGIEVTAQDLDGFTITSLAAGAFGYLAIIEE